MSALIRRGGFWIFLIGLTPLLWFVDGTLVTGGDHVFPLDPGGFFLNRLNVWDHRLGAGSPSAIYATSLIYHGIQALVARSGASLLNVQRITYVLWFMGLAASAYGLVWALQRARREPMMPAAGVIAALIYTYNPVMFNVWEGGKAGELSAGVGLPLVLAVLILAFHGLVAPRRAAAGLGLIAVFASEWGSPPILGMVLLVVGSYTACSVVHQWRTAGRQGVGRVAATVGWGLPVVVACSAFWWWPLFLETATRFGVQHTGVAALSNLGTVGMDNWLEGISRHTSLFNVMRLQGLWDWYEGAGSEPYVAYAMHYFRNPLLLGVGVALPVAAYGAVLLTRDFHTRWCAVMAAFMTVLACGAHPPTGGVYLWLAHHIPGFAAFRSPFYKFGLALVILYACLVSVTVRELCRRWPARRRWLIGGCAGAVVMAGFPMLTGAIFPRHDPTVLSSLKISVPAYVYEAAAWLARDAKPGRILSLPEQSSDSYTWGFASTLHLLNYLSDRSVLFASPMADTRYLEHGDQLLRQLMTDGLLRGDATPVAQIAHRLGVRYLLVRRDSTRDLAGRSDAAEQLEARLRACRGVRLSRTFGHWAFYEVDGNPAPHVELVPTTELLTGSLEAMLPLATQGALSTAPVFLKAQAIDPARYDQLPITGITWFNAQAGDTLLQQVEGIIRVPIVQNHRQTFFVPVSKDYFVGAARYLDAGSAMPLQLLVDDRIVAVQGSEPWFPPAEGWRNYGVYHLSRGTHTVNAVGFSAWNAPPTTIMVVPVDELAARMADWIPWWQAPDHALRWIFSPDIMETTLEPDPQSAPMVTMADTAARLPLGSPGADPWRAIIGGGPHWYLVNDAPGPVRCAMSFRVLSPGIERDLTLNVGAPPSPMRVLHAVGSKAQPVVVDDLIVNPGLTPVELYTPSTATASPILGSDGRYLSGTFLVSPVQVGQAVRSVAVYIPRRDQYGIQLIAMAGLDPSPPQLRLGQQALVMTKTPWGWTTAQPLTLDPGHCILTIDTPIARSACIQVASTAKPPAPPMPLAASKDSATSYRAEVVRAEPTGAFLVLRDAYHPAWELTTRFDTQSIAMEAHWEADGFSNAWWVPTLAPPQRLDLRYTIQTRFRRAAGLSAVTLLGCVLLLLAPHRQRPRRPGPP
ncbi:MAG: DUF3367 domain-containing protein [Candidatus Omnitrophica bacterium]|nr:DUF3367 domain-containing protein [Candidatus Omnitrophota bacterium]